MLSAGGSFYRLLYSNFFNQNRIRAALGAPVSTIINGDMSVWQRQTSFTSPATATYTADRFRVDYVLGGGGTVNITRQDLSGSLPGNLASNHQPRYCLRVAVNTTQASIAAGDFLTISQRIEKQQVRMLFDVASSLQIWVRTSLVGTYSIAIRDSANGQYYKQDFSIATPNVWTLLKLQNIPAFPGGANLGTNENDFSYHVSIVLVAGSTFQSATMSTWASGNIMASASQANFLGTAAQTFDMCLLQHEPGTVCGAFLPMSFQDNLYECARYYTQSYQYGTAPGTATSVGECAGVATSTTGAVGASPFPNRMRAIPTVSLFKPSTGGSGADGATTASPSNIGDAGFFVITGTGMTSGSSVAWQYTAAAEL